MKLLDIGEIYNRGLITSGRGQEFEHTRSSLYLYSLWIDLNTIPARFLGEYYENTIDKNISRNYASR